MEKPYYPGVTPSVTNLPPSVTNLPPPAYGPATPAVPIQYQPYYAPNSVMPSQETGVPPLQDTNAIIPKEPIYEPDYAWFSIFTMFCCCLPLGIAALVFSMRTMDANRVGNSTKARWNSKMASGLATTALGIGIVSIVVSSVILVWLYSTGRISLAV